MSKKKIFFFGTPNIAVPSLETLAKSKNIEIIGVGVFPDRKIGRKQILTPCPVKQTAQSLDLPIFEIETKTDIENICQKTNFDLGIVIAFGKIFSEKSLSLPKLGMVNVHFSLLPKYRGASPVQSAILNGDSFSGITFQQMTKKLDAGDILWQKKFNIEEKNTSEVFENFANETANELPSFIEKIETITPLKQKESETTFCSKFKKSDGEIFPKTETAKTIYQKYLAFDSFPGIFVKTNVGNVKLTKISILSTQNSIALECAQNTKIHISKAQIPGKKEMSIPEILNGSPKIFDFYILKK